MKRTATRFLVLGLVSLLLSCRPAEDTRPPNIVFILADDHAAQAISAYGSTLNQTPNIDRLAEEGLRLDNVFCTNSICAPSRAVILTGQYSHINGVLDNRIVFDSSLQTFPKLLRQNGYQTAAIGKWHLKSAPTGFDHYHVLPGQGRYYNPDFIENGDRKTHRGYVSELITDFALDWLRQRDPDKPFFLFLGHKAPHRNWMPGPDHLTLYDGADIPEPETLFDDYATRSDAAREQEMSIAHDLRLPYDLKVAEDTTIPGARAFAQNRLDRLTPGQRRAWEAAYGPKNERFIRAKPDGEALVRWKYQRYLKDYLRCVAAVDDGVGRVLDLIEAEGLTENTLVVYTSDQGFFLGEHGWFDKRFMYEESYRMPFLARFPGRLPAGSTHDALITNIDFAPTFLELAGVPVPSDMQGRSFAGLLAGGTLPDDWPQAAYYHYFEYPGAHMVKRHYGLRTPRYKLIHFYFDIDAWELYDLEEDPRELNNVYDDPAYAETVEELKRELRRQQERFGDDPAVFARGLEPRRASHLANDAAVAFLTPPEERFREGAETRLVDGAHWAYSRYAPIRPRDWVGFSNGAARIRVDLGRVRTIASVAVNTYQAPAERAYYPEQVVVEVSQDGRTFARAGGTTNMLDERGPGIHSFEVTFPAREARFLRLTAKPAAYIPAGRPGGGRPPLLLLDEVLVRRPGEG